MIPVFESRRQDQSLKTCICYFKRTRTCTSDEYMTHTDTLRDLVLVDLVRDSVHVWVSDPLKTTMPNDFLIAIPLII